MTLSYDGTEYHGWQVQPNGTTIQELVQDKLKILLRYPVTVIGSGRTDSGVHALEQTTNFKTLEPINSYRFLHSLNGLLPPDIRVHTLSLVPDEFHSQYSAIGKIYHYHLHLDRIHNPFTRRYRLHVREKIDLALLKQAAQLFVGTKDFTSFANEAHSGSAARDPIRCLSRLDVIDQEGGVRLEFEADGFLYKMVRNIVGMLLDISSGRRQPHEIPLIFEARDRRQAGMAAPPHALFLVKVHYPEYYQNSENVPPQR